MSNNKGFTLIELLMALALLVILSGALYGTYFSVIAARDKGGARIETRRELSTTLGALHSELASAYRAKPGLNATQTRTHFVVEDRDSFGKPVSLLEFTYLAPPRLSQVPSSDLTLVRYAVREKEGLLTLTREARDPYLNTSVKSVPYPVMDVVEGFLVECYDGSKWVKTWDSAPGYNSRFPNLVRVTVTLKGGEVFSTITTLRIGQ